MEVIRKNLRTWLAGALSTLVLATLILTGACQTGMVSRSLAQSGQQTAPASDTSVTPPPAPLPGAMPEGTETAGQTQETEKPDALISTTDVQPPLPPEGTSITQDYVYSLFQRGWYLSTLAAATPLAEEGNTSAQTLIGVLFEAGLGIPQDKEKAAQWYELAVAKNDPHAAYRLAQFCLLGTGVKQDKKRAADLFEIAAKAGNPEAKYNLALLYQEGEGRPYNEKKARELLEEAAEFNDPQAQYVLGLSYLEGLGGFSDPGKGAFWLGRAARRGNTAAQVYYGILRFQGKGVEPNEKEAADWFERAAQAGNPVAMNRLARVYAYGRGRQQDPVAAAAWHYAARALGVSDLKLDGFVATLNSDLLAEARKRAEQYTATVFAPSEDPTRPSP
ncbi:tetratricopeptide repeat protein [uncultured Roseibium sp.]|uniref:tetratricopeptide repeat protein n=1 Tax=uncultured Roseibium sp. TaxID=1936171 RepID=UPI00321665CF